MKGYLTPTDRQAIKNATTFEELTKIAVRVLERMPQPISVVCGPITTGGAGSIEKNLTKFRKTIKNLCAKGVTVFDQVPFEDSMQRIKQTPYYRGGNHLLETFYLPIFKSGLVTRLYLLPGWQGSQGATWEHEQALRLGIQIIYL